MGSESQGIRRCSYTGMCDGSVYALGRRDSYRLTSMECQVEWPPATFVHRTSTLILVSGSRAAIRPVTLRGTRELSHPPSESDGTCWTTAPDWADSAAQHSTPHGTLLVAAGRSDPSNSVEDRTLMMSVLSLGGAGCRSARDAWRDVPEGRVLWTGAIKQLEGDPHRSGS